MKCQQCERDFSNNQNLTRHVKKYCPVLNGGKKPKSEGEQEPQAKRQRCDKCEKDFVNKQSLTRHVKKSCSVVKGTATTRRSPPAIAVGRKKIDRPISATVEEGVTKLRSAFKNRIVSYRFTSPQNHSSYPDFFQDVSQKVFNVLDEYRDQHHAMKANFEVFGTYSIPEKELSDIKSFNTKNKVITESSDLKEICEEFWEEMMAQASEFQERDSGWTLRFIMFLDLNMNEFAPLSASSYIK